LHDSRLRVAFLVPEPNFHEAWDWAFDGEAAALVAAGLEIEPRPWTDPGELSEFDLILPLIAWGYHLRFAEWHALLDRLEVLRLPVVNPIALLRWNSDKSYLAELGAKGVPTVETRLTEALTEHDLNDARTAFACETLVIKPPISASADGTFKIGLADTIPGAAAGKPMLIQPWMAAITDTGEYSLMFFGGKFSHAIIKRPKAGDFRVQPHLGGSERPCNAPPGAEALASAALAAAPADAAYARVDMVADADGQLRIMELELIEPSLWLEYAPDGGASYAAAIILAARRQSSLSAP
jgi:glutathione synthase/RimK-type ligase-like ATP-grasp enzyme